VGGEASPLIAVDLGRDRESVELRLVVAHASQADLEDRLLERQ
jgi:hypothetical protein